MLAKLVLSDYATRGNYAILENFVWIFTSDAVFNADRHCMYIHIKAILTTKTIVALHYSQRLRDC